MTLPIPFGSSSTAADVLTNVDLAGRNVIVTGGVAGIGLETSRALAAAGAAVTIAARRPDEAERAVAELKQAMPESSLRVRRLAEGREMQFATAIVTMLARAETTSKDNQARTLLDASSHRPERFSRI